MDVLVEQQDEWLAWLESVDICYKKMNIVLELKLLQVLPFTGTKYEDYE